MWWLYSPCGSRTSEHQECNPPHLQLPANHKISFMINLKLADVRLSGQRSRPYLVEGGCDQHGRSPEELSVDTPGVCVLDKSGPEQISSEKKGENTVLFLHNLTSKLHGKKVVFIPIHNCSAITVRCAQWPSAPGSDQHVQNAFFNFLSFSNVLKATGLFLQQLKRKHHFMLLTHAKWV